MADPALPRGGELHHAVIGEDAEHDLHLRLEHMLGEDFPGMNIGEPGAPDRVVAFRRDVPGARPALEARIAEQLCNGICAHGCSFRGAMPARWGMNVGVGYCNHKMLVVDMHAHGEPPTRSAWTASFLEHGAILTREPS